MTDAKEELGPGDEQERIGGLAGLGAGLLTGARIGSAVLPVAGIGTFAGAIVGGVVGNEVGKRVGRALVNGFAAFSQTLAEG
jgi:outer membrane lipoprotein SlyB